MALIECAECGKEISDKATTCPNCGAPVAGNQPVAEEKPKKEKKEPKQYGCGTLIVVAVIAFVVFASLDNSTSNKSSKPKKPKTAAELRKEKVEKCFSGWSGAHMNLERQVKASMNDADSYDHVETRYSDKGDHLVVSTTFSGKNAFGGTVKNSVIAKTDLKCNVIEILN